MEVGPDLADNDCHQRKDPVSIASAVFLRPMANTEDCQKVLI